MSFAGKILVDTNIFIEHFAGRGTDRFTELVQQNCVLLSDIVYMELLQGVRKTQYQWLDNLLSGLTRVRLDSKVADFAVELLRSLKGTGYTLGVPDLILAAKARRYGVEIYSQDKIFSKIAAMGLLSDYSPGQGF